MKKDLSAFMPKALGHPYPGEVLRTAQEVAEKLRPFYESANFSMFKEALQKYPEQSFAQKFSLCNRQKFSGRKIKEGF